MKIYLSFINFITFEPFKRHPHKMVKHTQTFCWQQQANCLCMFDHYVWLRLKELKFIKGGSKETKKRFKWFPRQYTMSHKIFGGNRS